LGKIKLTVGVVRLVMVVTPTNHCVYYFFSLQCAQWWVTMTTLTGLSAGGEFVGGVGVGGHPEPESRVDI